MLSFGQSINDDNSQIEGKSVKFHNRSNSNGSGGVKVSKVIPGQLMPMPLNKSKSSGKFLTPNKSDFSNG